MPLFDTIKCYAPRNAPFTGHATMPLPEGYAYRRRTCPFTVRRNGKGLPTAWEPLARYPNGDASVIELVWFDETPSPDPSLPIEYEVFTSFTARPDNLIHPQAYEAMLNPGAIKLILTEQDGTQSEVSLSAKVKAWQIDRFSGLWAQGYRSFDLFPLSGHVWIGSKAPNPHIELCLNLHSGNYSIKPTDLYLNSLKLTVPNGWTWDPLFPEPMAKADDEIILPGNHVWPQTHQREWRFIIRPVNSRPANKNLLGWGVAKGWTFKNRAGYLAQGIPTPSLSWVTGLEAKIKARKADRFFRLENGLPSDAAYSTGTLGIWPVAGVAYGGMTGGIDVEQFPGIDTLAAGHPDGILAHMSEAMRYSSRQPGQIYEADGEPVRVSTHASNDGTIAWKHFNGFQAKRPFEITDPKDTHWDSPFDLDKARAASKRGICDYEATLRSYQPIDYQHFTRATKDYRALVYLYNDPIAKMRMKSLSQYARLTYWEKGNGQLSNRLKSAKSNPGQGDSVGRGEAWPMDVAAQAWAIGSDSWRMQWMDWWMAWQEYLPIVQMPNGAYGSQSFGKQAEDAPNGHLESDVCPFNFHTQKPGSNKKMPDFGVFRANEHIFILHAMRAILNTQFVSPAFTHSYKDALLAIWTYLWKPGANGPWQRFMTNFIHRPPFKDRTELTQSVPSGFLDHPSLSPDNYHVASSLGYGYLAGLDMNPASTAYTSQSSIEEAAAYLRQQGLRQIDSRALLLSVFEITGV